MGLSLSLVVDKYDRTDTPVIANNQFTFGDINRESVNQLREVALALPEGIEWFDGQGAKVYHQDNYGSPLVYVTAGLLLPRLATMADTQWKCAAVAFLKCIPASTRVILWWT